MKVIPHIGAIDMNSQIIKNVADPLTNQEVATKNYVDTKAFFTRAGGTVSGDLILKGGSKTTRFLGCLDLDTGTEFILLLGSDKNTLSYVRPDSVVRAPVKLGTSEVNPYVVLVGI